VVDHVRRSFDAASGIETLDDEVRPDDQLRAAILRGDDATREEAESETADGRLEQSATADLRRDEVTDVLLPQTHLVLLHSLSVDNYEWRHDD
jgi:hypothetical protein